MRLQPGGTQLRLGSHNVCGLVSPGRAQAAADAWRRLRFDVVFIQETHITGAALPRLEEELRGFGWAVYVAPTCTAAGGAAIAIRIDLEGGALVVDRASLHRAADGRLLHFLAQWGGHKLQLASIYMPNEPIAQRAFIGDRLVPLAAAACGVEMLWGGDFNFVPDQQLDRVCWRVGAGHAAEQGVAAVWRRQLGGPLTDVFRARHPSRTCFTRFGRGAAASAARLDRFYASSGLLPSVYTCDVPRTPIVRPLPSSSDSVFLSDHRPISLALLPAGPVVRGVAPVPRVRLAFVACEDSVEAFRGEVATVLASVPPGQTELLEWWPRAKRRMAALAGTANRAFRQRNRPAEAEEAATAVDAVYAEVEEGAPQAILGLQAATARYRRACMHSAEVQWLRQRKSWLHCREYPNPGLTRRFRPPRRGMGIPALRTSSGALCVRPASMARLMVRHWAGVSTAPPNPLASSAARAAVLLALHPAGSTIPAPTPPECAPLAIMDVSEAEVMAALRHSKGGTSPGLDGIPVDLYRCCREECAPVLARLFTAVWQLQRLPPGFHDGLVTVLHKSADRSACANYRPITLLGTDYRLFAKVLATRLGRAAGPLISPLQSAFLPGRRIGDNVMALQLIQHSVTAAGGSAYIAFCDFVKAYDTVSRDFLLAVMDSLGIPSPFLDIVRLLLSATRACAVVNGTLSDMVPFTAGVRQGCPLAPLLYLFIGEALQRWLVHCGVGVELGGRRWTAVQYADDTEVVLEGEGQVAAFVAAMDTFAEASGQRLHLGKTRLLPVGIPSPPPVVAGIAVVDRASALGFTFVAGGARPGKLEVDWQALMQPVRDAYARIKALGLSPMGRGLASAAYGVSRLLYHAEFVDMPATLLRGLQQATGRLVLGEAGDRGRFFTVPFALLAGSPKEGGFGALPWQQHVQARLIVWAGRLVERQQPWTQLAATLLARVMWLFPVPLDVPTPLRRILLATAVGAGGMPVPIVRPAEHRASSDWLDCMDGGAWPLPGAVTVPITAITVKQATSLLLGEVTTQRAEKFGSAAEAAGGTQSEVVRRFSTVWRLPWDNMYKTVVWRLLYNAIPSASRLAGFSIGPCACGCDSPDREHFFWTCPVADHMFQLLQRFLPGHPTLTKRHVWLGVTPPRIAPEAWCLVSLAALAALDHVRCFSMARHMVGEPTDLAAVRGRVVARFWVLLEDFRVLGPPQSFPSSPYIRFHSDSGQWSLGN